MLEGLAYRLVPIRTPKQENGRINTEVMYDNLMNKFAFRGMDDPDIYYNEEYQKFAMNTRQSYYRLAENLLRKKNDKARGQEVVRKCWESMPDEVFHFDVYTAQFLPLFFELELEETEELAYKLGDRAIEFVEYLVREGINDQQELQTNLYTINIVARALENSIGKEASEKYQSALQRFSSINI
jgi:hypothetical protein